MMFCQSLWRTEDLHLPRHPARSRSEIPKISRLLTYLLISGKKAHSSLEIAQALWPDDSTNPAKNMRNLIYRLRQTFGLISEKELIVSTASGYQFNPDLHIMTDYQQFDDLIQLASKASSVINRVELLKMRLTSIVEKFFLLLTGSIGLFSLRQSIILLMLAP